ncbi:MAG TPA: Rad52/Rad22 family DNA repair protein [Gemmatimonadaceae bacterium]|nr:Rad52/Rad22 family DNA repair protein [Gemmatimonadaceae bacterium]
MIARHETQQLDRNDIWSRLAMPVAPETIAWRQDGRPIQRDGRFMARFVAYIEANTVRERLDAVVPGEWDLTLELLPALPGASAEDGTMCSFKARLQVLGVIREDVGTGKDYKQASTDAFKRAAVRFGIGHELYGYGQNWVELDGDGKFARPVEDPAAAHARKLARRAREGTNDVAVPDAVMMNDSALDGAGTERSAPGRQAAKGSDLAALLPDSPACPKCGGKMWDNRLSKRNPKAPDYKCRDRSCDGVVWPQRGTPAAPADGLAVTPAAENAQSGWTDEIPF